MVNVAGGSTLVSGGLVLIILSGLYLIGVLLSGILSSGIEYLKFILTFAMVFLTFSLNLSSAMMSYSLYKSENGWIIRGSPRSIMHFHD